MFLNFSTVRFLTNSFGLRNSCLIEPIAGEVARACRGSLWRRLSRCACTMSLPEIRGYVRAQAAEFVQGEVEQAMTRHHLRRSLRRPLIDVATDQLIAMITRDVLSEGAPIRAETMAA